MLVACGLLDRKDIVRVGQVLEATINVRQLTDLRGIVVVVLGIQVALKHQVWVELIDLMPHCVHLSKYDILSDVA